MNKLFYPEIFHSAEEGGFWITFPDIPECMTQGDDMQHAYQKRTNSKAVKKTLTIPEWLNEEAMALGINFSQVLQEALIQKVTANSGI